MPVTRLAAEFRQMSPGEKQKVIKQIGQDARDNELNYRGCAQATLAALQKHLNIGSPAVFQSASNLSAGIGRSGEGACGALSGGAIAIGLVFGRDKLEPAVNSPGYQEGMNRTAKLCDRFQEQFAGIKCHDVQRKISGRAWNLRDPAEQQSFMETAHPLCAEVCRKAAEFAAEIILEP